MAPRSFWKGYLKLSLVTCPVAMTPATTDNEKVRFHPVRETRVMRIRERKRGGETRGIKREQMSDTPPMQ